MKIKLMFSLDFIKLIGPGGVLPQLQQPKLY